MAARVGLTTLGRFALTVDGFEHPGPSTAKSRALLAYLVRNRATAFARDSLVETFWPEADPDRGRGNLKTALWSIRRSLRDAGVDPDACIGGEFGTVRWIAPVDVDAERFADDAAQGDTAGLARYTGPFLEGLFDDWSLREREALEAAYEALLEKSLGEPSGVVNAHRLLERNPFNEEAWTVAIRAELVAGRRAAASELVRRARRSFEEARLPFSPEFEREFGRLSAEPNGPAELPLIEREADIARVHALLSAESRCLVLVSGQAGIGKTSFLDRIAWLLASRSQQVVRIRVPGESLSLEDLEVEFGAVPAVADGASPGARFGAELVARYPAAVFLVDDAHAIGGSVLDVVVAIARSARTVIATRPEGIGGLVGPDIPPIDASIVLGPLPRAATLEALIATNRLSADDAATVFARCDGYPFAMNAFLRLMHSGAAAETLPDEIALVVERRLRSRGERTARVAGIYAVEGSAATADVAELLRCGEDDVLDAIDDLLALGIFTDDDDGVRFEHDLFREGARKLVSSSRRKRVHAFFAERLASRPAQADLDRIAVHLSASDRHLDAARAYVRLGATLVEQRRFADARHRFDDAVAELARDDRPESRPIAIEAQTGLARSLIALGNYYPACAATAIAQSLLDPGDRPEVHADVLVVAAEALNNIEEPERAEALASRALHHARASGDEVRIAACASYAAIVATRAESPEGAAFFAAAADSALRSGDEGARLNAVLVGAFEHVRDGRYEDAMAAAFDAVQVRLSDPLLIARRLLAQSTIDLVVHRHAAARMKLREALGAIESLQPGRLRVAPGSAPERARYHCLRFLAGATYFLGDFEEAVGLAEAALSSPICAVASEYIHCADFYVKALLQRDLPGDRERARRALERIPSGNVANAAPFASAAWALVSAAFGETADVAARVREGFALEGSFWKIDQHELDEFYRSLARAAAQAGLTELAAEAEARGAAAFDLRRQRSGPLWGGPDRYVTVPEAPSTRPSFR